MILTKDILGGRSRRLDETYREGYGYKLDEGSQFGLDVAFGNVLDIDESRMSIVIPYADGNRRDGVGDLLEVGGINVQRHLSDGFSPYTSKTEGVINIPNFETITKGIGRDIQFFCPIVEDHCSSFVCEESGAPIIFSTKASSSSYAGFDIGLGILVCPAFYNFDDAARCNAKSFGNTGGYFASCISGMDQQDIAGGEFCIVIEFTFWHCSMSSAVFLIFARSAPTQISQMIVGLYSIKMPALHSFGTWADKSLKNKTMDELRAFQRNPYRKIAGFHRTRMNNASFHSAGCIQSSFDSSAFRPHSSLIGDSNDGKCGVSKPHLSPIITGLSTDAIAIDKVNHCQTPCHTMNSNNYHSIRSRQYCRYMTRSHQ